MRTLIVTIAAVALAACDSGSVPSPAERLQGQGSGERVDQNLIALHGEGLVVGSEAFYFAAGRSEVESALQKRLGDAMQRAGASACGAGPIATSTFPEGLTVNFQQGSLAGWNLSGTSDVVQVDADIGIGSSRDELEALSGFTAIGDSSLGEEFALGDTLGGFIRDGTVSTIYAGAQCFAR